MAKIHPFNKTLIKFNSKKKETILLDHELRDLCVDELIYHCNSINNYLCKSYYNDKKDVHPEEVAYLIRVQAELSTRLLTTAI